jgi:hypothetical protein
MWIKVGKFDIKTDNVVAVEQIIRESPSGAGSVNAVRLYHSFHTTDGVMDDVFELDTATSALFLTMLHSQNFSQWDFVLDTKTPDIDAAYGAPQ